MNGGDLQTQLLEHLPQADAVIAGLEPYTRSMLETAKNLKIISRYGVGYDKVDLEAAHAMGIKVSITPGANSDSVADLAMTLMLAAARNVCPMDAAIRAGGHDKPITGVEMWNKTLGVVGTGRIGKGVIQRASGFQMKVLANDAYPDPAFVEAHNGKYVDLDTLFAIAASAPPLTASLETARPRSGGGIPIAVARDRAFSFYYEDNLELLEELGADYLAVSSLDEAMELRAGGIHMPILILGHTPPERVEELLRYHITQTVTCEAKALEYSAEAVRCGGTLKVHIKVDTGMSRLGFLCGGDHC
mgnify:CR=1 FL=1